MMSAMTVRIRCWLVIAVACFLAAWTRPVFAQDENGCQGVGFSKQSFKQYSPERLRERISRNPTDVDALIIFGIHLEEQDQINQAEVLYERAIKAKPNCALGYYFSGLAEERISDNAATDAEVKIRKAISLDQSLRNDPNMQGFLKRRFALMGGAPSKRTESLSDSKESLASVNRFTLGVGAGLLLSAACFYLSRPRLVTAAKGTGV